jgi:hypothetical protein
VGAQRGRSARIRISLRLDFCRRARVTGTPPLLS